MTSSYCEHCGGWAGGGCRCEDAIAMEKELRDLKGALFLVVQRLGGEVELTAEELSSLEPSWELVSWPNPATGGHVVKCRKPKKEST